MPRAKRPAIFRAEDQVIALSINGSVLTLEFHYPDDYTATVLYEDIAQRLQCGEGVILELGVPREDP